MAETHPQGDDDRRGGWVAGLRARLNTQADAAFSWWRGELAGLIPSRWRALYSQPMNRFDIRLLAGTGLPPQVDVFRTKATLNATMAPAVRTYQGDWPGAVSALQGRARRKLLSTVTLQIPLERCLQRDLTLPVQALGQLRDVLALNIAQALPFAPDDVHFGWRVLSRTDQEVAVRQMIVKRTVLQPLIDDLRVAGLSLDAVNAVDADRVCSSTMLDHVEPGLLHWLDRVFWAALATGAVLAMIAAWATIQRQDRTGELLAAEIARTKLVALEVRKKISAADAAKAQIVGLRLRKIETLSLTAVWEEISRLLPETAWLTELRLDDDVVVVNGYARSASELPGLFSRSSVLKNVSFASPVARDQQSGMERFELRMKAGQASDAGVGGVRNP
jgi:general secretion pathway protein L